MGIIGFIFLAAVVFGVFMMCRSIALWYFNITEITKNQKETNKILTDILNQLNKDEVL